VTHQSAVTTVRFPAFVIFVALTSCAVDPYLECGDKCADGGKSVLPADASADSNVGSDAGSSDRFVPDVVANDGAQADSGVDSGAMNDSGVNDTGADVKTDSGCKQFGATCSQASECCSNDCSLQNKCDN